ncbi:MAG: hypothetical protein A2X12_11570 [Bacteroidetes bacterium GWE2_29_8]|nr:MAG: hypothetical protein A2X12_11570 [Bacteroidetes bacterium GWE2_29_8]OFY24390.1 MAG: hypothetical protein A2X02_08345 [Bacteroidetes bacterium GWF2_29_10]
MKKVILGVLFLLILTTISFAQKRGGSNEELTTKSEKAKKLYDEATSKYDEYKNEEAIDIAKKAVDIDPNFIEALYLISYCYKDMRLLDSSIKYMQIAIDVDPLFFPNSIATLADVQLKNGYYADARKNYLLYKELFRDKKLNIEALEENIAKCDFAIKLMRNPVPFNPENLGANINTKYDEYHPTLTADEQTLIFTVKEPEQPEFENNLRMHREDFYVSLKRDSVWSKRFNLGRPINKVGYNEGAQCITSDGLTLYFTACEREDGYGSCDIYFSKKEGVNWGIPQNMGEHFNSRAWDSQPSISPDGKVIYFTSARPGGIGGMDIWKSDLQSDGSWSVPVNMGDSINTAKEEMSPFIHFDNQTFYFASSGHLGMGGIDLFYSKLKDGVWSKPTNLGYPINTNKDEISLIINANADKGFFASDKKSAGSFGGLDLYIFDLYKDIRPQAVTYMKGHIIEKASGLPIVADVELIDLETEKSMSRLKSDDITGEFLICIPTNKNYAINVSKSNYLFFSENVALKGIQSITKPYYKKIELSPIKVGESVVLKNIFFKTASFELEESSKVELLKLVEFLNLNKFVKIEISGHTDDVGDDKSNMLLSERRAKAVYDYLVKKEIVSTRLVYKGYGETKPIDSNKTEEGRANNRRTEFKVIGV